MSARAKHDGGQRRGNTDNNVDLAYYVTCLNPYQNQSELSYEIDPAVFECKLKTHTSIHLHKDRELDLHANDHSHCKWRHCFSFNLPLKKRCNSKTASGYH